LNRAVILQRAHGGMHVFHLKKSLRPQNNHGSATQKRRSIQYAKSAKEGRTHLILGTQHDDLGDHSERQQQLK
jgi:hypothetical protein